MSKRSRPIDLDALFDGLNKRYFEDKLARVQVWPATWLEKGTMARVTGMWHPDPIGDEIWPHGDLRIEIRAGLVKQSVSPHTWARLVGTLLHEMVHVALRQEGAKHETASIVRGGGSFAARANGHGPLFAARCKATGAVPPDTDTLKKTTAHRSAPWMFPFQYVVPNELRRDRFEFG